MKKLRSMKHRVRIEREKQNYIENRSIMKRIEKDMVVRANAAHQKRKQKEKIRELWIPCREHTGIEKGGMKSTQ